MLITIIPCLIGLGISYKFPLLKDKLLKLSKRIVFLLLLLFVLITLISKFYILKLITLKTWFTAPIIPWGGFILGALFAFISKRPKEVLFNFKDTFLKYLTYFFFLFSEV